MSKNKLNNNGMPTVIFKLSDYYRERAEHCRYTIIAKFVLTSPNLEHILWIFSEKISLEEDIKIGVRDFCMVFIDVIKDDDCKMICFKRSIEMMVRLYFLKNGPQIINQLKILLLLGNGSNYIFYHTNIIHRMYVTQILYILIVLRNFDRPGMAIVRMNV